MHAVHVPLWNPHTSDPGAQHRPPTSTCCRVEALLVQQDAAAAELAEAKADRARLQASVSGTRGGWGASARVFVLCAGFSQAPNRVCFNGFNAPAHHRTPRNAELKQQAHQLRRMVQQLQGEKEAAQGA